MAALRLAALRGVDVRIIVPDKSDNIFIDLATRWLANELSDVEIHFLRYTDGFPSWRDITPPHRLADRGRR